MSKIFYAVLFTVFAGMGAMAQEESGEDARIAPEQTIRPIEPYMPSPVAPLTGPQLDWEMILYEYNGGFGEGPKYETQDACKKSATFIVETLLQRYGTVIYCSNVRTGDALKIEKTR